MDLKKETRDVVCIIQPTTSDTMRERIVLWSLVAAWIVPAAGCFALFAHQTTTRRRSSSFFAPTTHLYSTPQQEASSSDFLEDAQELDLSILPHRPLGCTVEESLASRHVFVTKVNEGGNAAKAGLLVGDVIVGMTDLFGNVIDVTEFGVDQM